jgi:hypothetical protein
MLNQSRFPEFLLDHISNYFTLFLMEGKLSKDFYWDRFVLFKLFNMR